MDVLWGKDWNEFKRDRSFDELIKERGNNNDGGFKICESLQVFNFLSRLRVYLEKKMTLIQTTLEKQMRY